MSDMLEVLRTDIAECDREIMVILRKRLDLAISIGKYKAEHGMGAHNPSVEKRVIERYREIAVELGMNPDIAERICRCIMEESVANEEAVIDKV
ncbi:MAG: chorismate mutase [Methanomethylophilus sp.]|jgi:chorismate mutase-like protein|nr:chorismate mutase AroH2 [methanogenic archaeon ISO4-H5]MEE3363479.1 chorismate mutase [Methanomethylophilus sp.]MEE3477552.1 chorismate mutase [Methanomethylophilus sp.]